MKIRAIHMLVLLVVTFSCEDDEQKPVRCSFQFSDKSYHASSAHCSANYSWYYATKDYALLASGNNFSLSFLEIDQVSLNGSESVYSRSIRLYLADTDLMYTYFGTDAFERSTKSIWFNIELHEFDSGEAAGLLVGNCACSSGDFRTD